MVERKLGKKQVESFHKQLRKIKEDIVSDIRKMTAGNSPDSKEMPDDTGHSMHMADVATDMYDREFNLGLASNDRLLLQKVENALKRIEDSKYGLCLECGKTILKARLEAIPYAECCLKCQEEKEKNS